MFRLEMASLLIGSPSGKADILGTGPNQFASPLELAHG